MKRLLLALSLTLLLPTLHASKAVVIVTTIRTVTSAGFDFVFLYTTDSTASGTGSVTIGYGDSSASILTAIRNQVIALCACGLAATDVVVFGHPMADFGAGLAATATTTIPATSLPLPGASALGGVRSIACSVGTKISAIGTDGIPVCTAESGGSDPWTYVVLGSDFVTSSSSAVDVTGLAFAPAANQRYEIHARFLLRTATATVVPRVGVAWPTGMTDGTAAMIRADSATSQTFTAGNINASMLQAVGALANNTQSWPSTLDAVLIAGSSPGATFKIQLASETAATNVTIKAGSYLRYRTY